MRVGERVELIGPSTPGLPREGGLHNVNGPCLTRMPDWAPGCGRYHLYFAHHHGQIIRLACADTPTGPWQLIEGGCLAVEDTPATGLHAHIASPDVHVDHVARRLVMYFHAPVDESVAGHLPSWRRYPTGRQHTLVATSADGLKFEVGQPRAVAPSYLRVFEWRHRRYGLAMPGQLVRLTGWAGPVDYGPDLFGDSEIRHSAVRVDGDELGVWFTRAGDTPERILFVTVRLHDDWNAWRPSKPVEVMRPAEEFEGASIEPSPSVRGAALEPRRELRDPYVFDDDGCRYLAYAAAGETAIGLTRLVP